MCHYLVTASSLPQYQHTEEIDMRYVQFVHSQLGNCFLMIEDTPGWPAGDRKDDFPDLLTSVETTYLFCDDGVKKKGWPDPPSADGEDAIPWWAFWDDGVRYPDPPEPADEAGQSPLDGKGDAEAATTKRQAFIVVYSVKDEASFKEAEELVAELMGLMEPPIEDPPAGGDDEKKKMKTEDVELPPMPIVLVSTHNDLKKNGPGTRVASEAGSDLAASFGLPFFELNAQGLGVNDAFEAAVTSISTCENNMTFSKAPGILSRCKAQCCLDCPEECCYPGIVVEKMCPNGEQPKHPCRKESWDKKCCWKNAS